MGFRPYLCGLAALVSVALSSPAKAQENFEENCAHVFEAIPPNPFDPIPINPFCTDEDVQQWREDSDLADTHLQLRDPTQLYPRWQRSAGGTSIRLELPNHVYFNLGDESIQIREFSLGMGDDEWLWRGNDLREYFRQFTKQEITVRDGDMVYTLDDFLTTAQQDIPLIISGMTGLISELWMDIRGIFNNGNPLIALDFNIFFTNLLPRYTNDGVITPEEAQEIAERTRQKIERVYNRVLTDEERSALDDAINEFTQETNNLLDSVMIDNLLQPILADPWGSIFFGEHSTQEYRELGEDILSMMDVTIQNNMLQARLDAYARLTGQSDYMSTYFFHTDRGDYIVRHGTHNYTSFLSEAHLQIDAEFHGGRPLSELSGQIDQETLDAITQIEQLLGYQPVTIDANIEGSLIANVVLENLIRDAYEVTLIRSDLRHGMGFAHGYVYRFNLGLDAGLQASINSFTYQIDTHFHFDLEMTEESGRQVLLYRFVEGRYDPVWFGISAGSLWEHLSVREFERSISFDAVSDFEGNMEQSFSDTQSERTYTEQRLRPTYSGVFGVNFGAIGMFATVRDGSLGAGLYLVTPQLTMDGRVDDAGRIHLESIGALGGHIDVDEAQAFHRDRLIEQFSLFPAKRAAVWDLTNLYLSRAMHGLFLESSVDLNFIEQPHAGPMIARLGLMVADDGYIRFGIMGTPNFRTYGSYAGGGNDIGGITAMVLQERTYGRDSMATSLAVQTHLNIGDVSLHLGAIGTMVTPELSEFLGYARRTFGYTYTLNIEGVL